MELTFRKDSTWIIAYIDKDHIGRVEKDLAKYKDYGKISVYIPTVKILKKQFKGQNIFEEIPMLFNYGFFQIPKKNISAEFLQKLKEDIPCIHAWVKDPKMVISSYNSKNKGNKEPMIRSNLMTAAMCTKGEMQRILRAHKELSIYDKNDIDKLGVGDTITLTGYPFEGLEASVISVDKKKQKINVRLGGMEGLMKKVTVSFDNVFYTVYHGPFDENDFKEKPIDEIRKKGRNSATNYLRDNQ